MKKIYLASLTLLASLALSCEETACKPEVDKAATFVLGDRQNDNTGVYLSDLIYTGTSSNIRQTTRIVAAVWTQDSERRTERSYIKFDLSSIRSNAIIASAKLILHTDVSLLGGHNNGRIEQENSWDLLRLTEGFSFETITWNTQPKYNATIINPRSTSFTQDYVVDVTSWVQGHITTPSSNYGFGIKMNDESSSYRSVNFASGSYQDHNLRPTLVIKFQ